MQPAVAAKTQYHGGTFNCDGLPVEAEGGGMRNVVCFTKGRKLPAPTSVHPSGKETPLHHPQHNEHRQVLQLSRGMIAARTDNYVRYCVYSNT